MTQHDYVIDNQSAPNFRSDLNNALSAIATTNSGGTAPSTTYAGQLWHDTSANQLKIRAEANDAWIVVADLNQSADTSAPPDLSVTFGKLAASTFVTESEDISNNDNDTTLPTSAAVKDFASGTFSLNTNGYQILPSGLYIQWGRVTGVNYTVLKTVSFPIQFPNACFSITLTPRAQSGSDDFEVDKYSVAAKEISTSQFTVMSEGTGSGSNQTIFFMAYGH